MTTRDEKNNIDVSSSHTGEVELTNLSTPSGIVQKIQEWHLRRKIARKTRILAKKLVMVDDVMLIHTDEII